MNNLDTKVSLFKNHYAKDPLSVESLSNILIGDRFKAGVETLRNDPEPERRNGRKAIMPCFTPCGIFTGRDLKDLTERSGIICLDFDEKDNIGNPTFDRLKELCEKLPFVLYCGHSVGGVGYFILIPIRRKDRHEEHYAAATAYFRSIGLTPDEQCKNINRMRCVSYDPEPYINEHAKLFQWLIATPTTPESEKEQWVDAPNAPHADKSNDGVDLSQWGEGIAHDAHCQGAEPQGFDMGVSYRVADMCLCELEQMNARGVALDIAYDRGEWVSLSYGFANVFGENGRDLYHRYSSLCPDKYRHNETDKVFTDALTHARKDANGDSVKGIGDFIDKAKHYIGEDKLRQFYQMARSEAVADSQGEKG